MGTEKSRSVCLGVPEECRWHLCAGKSSDVREIGRSLTTDELTGLPNRTRLIRDLAENACPVLFLINVDGFSQINNTFGIENGDNVLVELAELLKNAITDQRMWLYKMPADEFALLTNLEGADSQCMELPLESVPWEELGQQAEQIVRQIAESRIMMTDAATQLSYEVHLTATIGIAVARVVSRHNVLTRADVALKTAKSQHKPYLFFRQSMDTQRTYAHNIRWARRLNQALASNRVVVYYQPIVDNRTGQAEKHEALVRLLDPVDQPVAPFKFLPLSRILRLYPEITRRVAEKAVAASSTLGRPVSINLSIHDMLDHQTREMLWRLMAKDNAGRHVTFEILESEGIDNYDAVADFINSFKQLGCKFALDDFGSGYSNFAHVVKLQVDYLKIDATLIREMDRDENARQIVRAIVGFSHQMGIHTIAEYVHSPRIFSAAIELGIDYSQGYYLGKPTPTPEAITVPVLA